MAKHVSGFKLFIKISLKKVNKKWEYPQNECSMHGYLIQNITAEQDKYFDLKNKKFRNNIPFSWIYFAYSS